MLQSRNDYRTTYDYFCLVTATNQILFGGRCYNSRLSSRESITWTDGPINFFAIAKLIVIRNFKEMVSTNYNSLNDNTNKY